MFAPTTVGVAVRGTPATLMAAKGEMGDVVARDVAAMCAPTLTTSCRTDCLAAGISFRLPSHARQRGVNGHLNSRRASAARR